MEGHVRQEGMAGLYPTLTSARLFPDRGHRAITIPRPVSLNFSTPSNLQYHAFLYERNVINMAILTGGRISRRGIAQV